MVVNQLMTIMVPIVNENMAQLFITLLPEGRRPNGGAVCVRRGGPAGALGELRGGEVMDVMVNKLMRNLSMVISKL